MKVAETRKGEVAFCNCLRFSSFIVGEIDVFLNVILCMDIVYVQCFVVLSVSLIDSYDKMSNRTKK